MTFSKNESQTLCQHSFLASLPTECIDASVAAAERVSFASGEYIHSKGDEFTGVFVLLEGEIKALGVTSEGAEYSLVQLGPGQSFGEIAYLDGGDRTHDALCLTDCVLAKFSHGTLDSLCEVYPAIYHSLVKLACRHIRQSFQMLDDFLTLTPEQLLAKRLLYLAESQHTPTDAVAIKQDDLAALVGVSRQSVNRVLRKWQEAGWITISYSAIRVNHPEALRTLYFSA